MQRNNPWIFSLADDQDKDGFKLENVGPTFSSFDVEVSQAIFEH